MTAMLERQAKGLSPPVLINLQNNQGFKGTMQAHQHSPSHVSSGESVALQAIWVSDSSLASGSG